VTASDRTVAYSGSGKGGTISRDAKGIEARAKRQWLRWSRVWGGTVPLPTEDRVWGWG